MANCRFEIRYTQCWFNASSLKKEIRRCSFSTDDFQEFSSYYRYLRYGDIPVRVRIQLVRLNDVILPFSFKTQRVKGVSRNLFNLWEAHLFDLL